MYPQGSSWNSSLKGFQYFPAIFLTTALTIRGTSGGLSPRGPKGIILVARTFAKSTTSTNLLQQSSLPQYGTFASQCIAGLPHPLHVNTGTIPSPRQLAHSNSCFAFGSLFPTSTTFAPKHTGQTLH